MVRDIWGKRFISLSGDLVRQSRLPFYHHCKWRRKKNSLERKHSVIYEFL
jgi:hypothetical protein